MTDKYILQKLQDCYNQLDTMEYAAMRRYIADVMEEGINFEYTDIIDIANELRIVDYDKPLPRVVFDLLVEIYQEGIARDDADAMNDLGALYYDGRGCEQDYTKAVHYYQMAAENGSYEAQENLGYCYYYGRNVPVDYEKAFQYFALGAFNGQLISLYKIGDMYQHGYYVPKNEKQAFAIYTCCIEALKNDDDTYISGPVFLRLGNCFLNGIGTEVRLERALSCFQQAELCLYKMIRSGERWYRKSLEAAIEGQAKVRAMLMAEL